MMQIGILAVSFGTSYTDTYEKTILTLERDMKNAYPQHAFASAYTSDRVRAILMRRGLQVHSIKTAIDYMLSQKVSHLVVQPTHLLMGIEYEKLCTLVKVYSREFDHVVIGKPLLSSHESIERVISIIADENPIDDDTALVLMGHGSEHFANTVYPAMDYMAKAAGYPHLYVGTVEGYPTIDTVLAQLKKTSYKKLLLAPLMLVAGDHAVNDMAGDDEDSWKKTCEAHGFQVSVSMKGLGESQAIRQVYLEHLKRAMLER